jgi:hypothetical protein
MIGYIFKMDDTYYFVQAHEVQSNLYNCGRYYSSYFLRVLISLGKVFNLLLGNLKQIDFKFWCTAAPKCWCYDVSRTNLLVQLC